MIEIDKLNKGSIYRVSGLNFNVAIWTGESFRGPAFVNKKLLFLEEKHYVEGLPYGTCTPLEELSNSSTILSAPFDGMNLLKVLYILDSEVF